MALAQDETIAGRIGRVLRIHSHDIPVGRDQDIQAGQRRAEVRRAGGVGHLDDFEAQLTGDQFEIGVESWGRSAQGK